MKKINLLLPVESINREIDYKLFLATSLANKNTNVVIAQHDYFNTDCSLFKEGIYIGKCVFKSNFSSPTGDEVDIRFYNEIKKNNILLIHLHEEGGLYAGDKKCWETELDIKLDPKVLMKDDYIFTWGSFQKKYYQTKNSMLQDSNIIDCGHPKFELCKPRFRAYYEKEIDEIKAKYGSFVLVNTNHDIANPLAGLEGIFSRNSFDADERWCHYSLRDDQMRLKFVKNWSFQTENLSDYVSLLHKLSVTFPDKTFILRPHPCENPEYYKTVFFGIKNIHVEKTNVVQPWIMAADLVIQNGCTTALETFLAETPVVTYRPIENERFEIKLPNQFGVQCTAEDDVVQAIVDIGKDPKPFIKKNSLTPSTKSLIKNLEKNLYDEVISLVNNIIQEKLKNNVHNGEISIRKLRFREIRNSLMLFCRALVRIFFIEKRIRYASAKVHFPGFDQNVVAEKIKETQDILNKKVSLEYLSDRLLIITGGEANKS